MAAIGGGGKSRLRLTRGRLPIVYELDVYWVDCY